jgi:hypothetical protein
MAAGTDKVLVIIEDVGSETFLSLPDPGQDPERYQSSRVSRLIRSLGPVYLSILSPSTRPA